MKPPDRCTAAPMNEPQQQNGDLNEPPVMNPAAFGGTKETTAPAGGCGNLACDRACCFLFGRNYKQREKRKTLAFINCAVLVFSISF